MSDSAVPTGLNGRTSSGKFGAGNQFAKGNPLNRRANQLRKVLLDTVQDEDIVDVVRKLIEKAREGDIPATKELLDRSLGKPQATITVVDEEESDFEEMTDAELLAVVRKERRSGD